MSNQLFYGKLSGVTPIGSGSNSYIRVRGDFDTSSKTITNVIDVAGYFNIDYVKPGQTFVAGGPFTAGTTVVSVDTGANTIDVADFPATTVTNTLARISPADGDYYIASASFFDPNTTTPITFKNITGSSDANYNGSTPIYAIIAAAANSAGTLIPGRYHKYDITEVLYRSTDGLEASVNISWGEDGTQASNGDQFSPQTEQAYPIVSLTTSESLAPIFATNLSGITDLPAGSNFAPYQIELQNFFDDLTITDVFYTGSLVVGNASNLNFSGSGVEITASGSDGVLINITGGAGGAGTSGSSGSSGTSGSSGSSGTSGIDGSSGSSGTSGIDGSSGSSGTSGADGSSGSSGTSGSSGSSGTSGADGSSGSSGTSGADGSSGSSGSSGTSGADGSSGSSGTSGADGSSGSSGTSGSSGSSGTSGADGSSGSSGTSGADGSSGSSGTSGIDGSSGSSGSSGTSGADGSSGSSGTSGADGSSGSSGTSGIDGSSGSSGSSGTSGADGSSGSSGTSGADGSSGSSGTSGSSGSSGTSGADGSSGSSGTSGADGSSGSSGTSGIDGSSGSSGSSGTSGSSGSSGTSGADGSSGSSGTSGADGSSGSSGTSGADGSSGSSGTSGSSGSSGTSGIDGSSGSSGTSGADGSSGSSGTSGADGSSGSSGTSGSSGSSGTSGSATISNNIDNYLLTATGTDTINGESALTFDGTILTQNSDFERRTSEITVNDGASGNLVSVPTANYLGLVLDYTLLGNDGRARFGTIRAIFDSSSIIIDEVTSTDLNNPTDDIIFTASTGTNAVITVNNGSGSGYNVTVKSFTNLIER